MEEEEAAVVLGCSLERAENGEVGKVEHEEYWPVAEVDGVVVVVVVRRRMAWGWMPHVRATPERSMVVVEIMMILRWCFGGVVDSRSLGDAPAVEAWVIFFWGSRAFGMCWLIAQAFFLLFFFFFPAGQ